MSAPTASLGVSHTAHLLTPRCAASGNTQSIEGLVSSYARASASPPSYYSELTQVPAVRICQIRLARACGDGGPDRALLLNLGRHDHRRNGALLATASAIRLTLTAKPRDCVSWAGKRHAFSMRTGQARGVGRCVRIVPYRYCSFSPALLAVAHRTPAASSRTLSTSSCRTSGRSPSPARSSFWTTRGAS